jgi:hypothetical protein
VTWVEHSRPWELEQVLLKKLALPLNIDGNDHHQFHSTLRACRRAARLAAAEIEVLKDSGGPRHLNNSAT